MEISTILPYIPGTLGGLAGMYMGYKISKFAQGSTPYERKLVEGSPNINLLSSPKVQALLCAVSGTILGHGLGTIIVG